MCIQSLPLCEQSAYFFGGYIYDKCGELYMCPNL